MLVTLVNDKTNKELEIFSGVKGLVSHGEQLKQYLQSRKPGILLVSISAEEVIGLAEFIKSPFEMNLSDYEIIYGVRLSKYGEVMTPPPIYTETVIYATENKTEVVGIDLPQQEFDRLYTDSMKTRHLIRHSIRKKRVLNRDYHDTNEYEFAERWIERINAVKGLANIDSERVDYMEKEILKYVSERENLSILVIIDHEFYKPLLSKMQKDGWNPMKS